MERRDGLPQYKNKNGKRRTNQGTENNKGKRDVYILKGLVLESEVNFAHLRITVNLKD